MRRGGMCHWLMVLVGSLWLATSAQASTQAPQPVIEKARSGSCVADPAFMRRNHMDLLKHQRNDTLREGNRSGKFSLRECITCHASQATNSVIATETNFCQSCHQYAAVKIDCFECHAGKPQEQAANPAAPRP